MTIYEIIGFSLLFIGTLELFLGIILFRNNPRHDPVQKAVTALALFSAAFSLTSGSMYLRASLGLPIDFAARFNWIGWFTVPAALQVLFFLKDDRGSFGRIIGIVLYPLWVVILGLCLFTDLIVAPGYSVIPFVNHYGPLEHAGRLFGTLLAFWLIYECVRLKKSMVGVRKAQFNYFFYGLLIFGGGASFTAGFLQLVGGVAFEPGLASFFSFPWVILTFYACIRYSLFDIRTIVSRTLTVIFLFIVVALIHFGTIAVLSPLLGDVTSDLISLSLIGFIFYGTPLRSRVQTWIASIVLKGRFDYQQLLRESTNALVTILDLDDLLAYIISSISHGLRTEKIHLFLKGMDCTYRIQHSHGMAPVPPVSDDTIRWLEQTRQVLIRQELEMAPSAKESGRLYRSISQTDIELIVPLVYKGQIGGFITVGKKGSGEPYVQSDIDLLVSMASHAAVAIENARLFEETRRMNKSFQESEAKFRTLADTAAVAIFIHQGGNFLYANRTAELICGYAPHEYLTMNFLSLAHPDYVDMIKTRAQERLAGHAAPPQYEFPIIRKDGELRWVLMTAGITTYEGKPAVIGTLIDISVRKQAEEERERYYQELQQALLSLKESETKFRTLAETTAAGIVIHQGGRLSYVNPATEKITGHTREFLLTLDFWEVIHPDDRALVKERGSARLRGAVLVDEYEYRILTKSGAVRWVNMSAGIIEYQGKPAVIATIFDITDRKDAEAATLRFYEESVKQYEDRIEEEKRHLAEKEKLLKDLHDGIGGITTNISMLAELAKSSDTITDIRKTLSTISELSREGLSEIRNFMNSLDTRDMNWQTLLAEIRNQGNAMIGPHGMSFDLTSSIEDTDDQPGSLLCLNLFKIYREALMNIIKHSQAKTVKAELSISRNRLRLVIQDDGVGVGTGRVGGRGLTNMQTRARDLGGEITLNEQCGTCVTLEIPLPLQDPHRNTP
jgi:PAS domain S-box-containing protein